MVFYFFEVERSLQLRFRLCSREVQISEFFVVFFGGFVVGFCSFDFVFEVTEGDGIAIGCNFSNELLFTGVEAYAFIF